MDFLSVTHRFSLRLLPRVVAINSATQERDEEGAWLVKRHLMDLYFKR